MNSEELVEKVARLMMDIESNFLDYDGAHKTVALVVAECAKVAKDFTDAQHIAHDISAGLFPKRSNPNDAIAAAIISLAPYRGGRENE